MYSCKCIGSLMNIIKSAVTGLIIIIIRVYLNIYNARCTYILTQGLLSYNLRSYRSKKKAINDGSICWCLRFATQRRQRDNDDIVIILYATKCAYKVIIYNILYYICISTDQSDGSSWILYNIICIYGVIHLTYSFIILCIIYYHIQRDSFNIRHS